MNTYNPEDDSEPGQQAVAMQDAPMPVEISCSRCGGHIELSTALQARLAQTGRLPALTCVQCIDADRRQREQQANESAIAKRTAAISAARQDLPAVLASCGVPSHWHAADLNVCPDLPTALVVAARRWLKSPSTCLYLFGPPGSAKTYMAVAILREAIFTGKLSPNACRFVSERGYLDGLKATFGDAQPPVRTLPASHPRRVQLLVLDDLGSLMPTAWRADEIFALIEGRHADGLPTIITSNLDLDALAKVLDTRASSRIAEGRAVLNFPARDLRKAGSVRPPAATLIYE